MANYTVVKGDTLSELAQKFGTTVSNLVNLNNIKDPDFIVVGQVLKTDGTADPVSTNTTSRPTITVFGLQSNTDRTVYATWTWDKSNTENYQCYWTYDTGDGVWFVGSNSTVEDKQSTYNAPSNAKRVKFKVKPISEKKMVNNKETSYWTAGWSTEKEYNFSNNPPSKPSTPDVKIEKYTLTATLSNLDVNGTHIEFQVVKDDSSVFKTGTARITTSSATFSCSVTAGSKYKVRCRAKRGDLYSDWTNYSSNASTIPAVPSGITSLKATSDTSIYVEWSKVNTATSYDLEYATKKDYFDNSDQTTPINGIEFTHYEKTGLESGEEYFFRVRATNSEGSSAWSGIKSIVIGKKPIAPTTWSSTTTVIVGEKLVLFWVHNAEDGSSQTYAELEMTVNGITDVYTIENKASEEDKDKTSSYEIDTSKYVEGTKIEWRVRTAGITRSYGDWSTQRTVDVYAPPTIEITLRDSDSNDINTLTNFPCYVRGLAGPNTQLPIGYHVSVISNDIYETVDNVGNPKIVNKGESVYSNYFDTSYALLVELNAGNIDLENNVTYTLKVTVAMNSGLTAESSLDFKVAWTDIEYEPNAEIAIDESTYSASIRPYCEDEFGNLIKDVLVSLYRRDFDGNFTEICKDLDNTKNTYVTDPHPALDYARYRVVATTKSTGAMSYCDIPGVPVNGQSIIIQWDENWTTFNTLNADELEQPEWSGNMLKLPYNIDISENHSKDATLIEYIGRSHPVSYYGTQLGESQTWNVVIAREDDETLYGLRRLARWMGDVYVREPSGIGYWAAISVSFSQKHLDLTIPVTLDITRVSGGV